MMIINQSRIKLPARGVTKVLCSYDGNTYVILYKQLSQAKNIFSSQTQANNVLLHTAQDGRNLHQKFFKEQINQILMANNQTVLLLSKGSNKITLHNLKTHTDKIYQMKQKTCEIYRLMSFNNSGILGSVQFLQHNDYVKRISYYCLNYEKNELSNKENIEDSRLVCQIYKGQYFQDIWQGNNDSLIIARNIIFFFFLYDMQVEGTINIVRKRKICFFPQPFKSKRWFSGKVYARQVTKDQLAIIISSNQFSRVDIIDIDTIINKQLWSQQFKAVYGVVFLIDYISVRQGTFQQFQHGKPQKVNFLSTNPQYKNIYLTERIPLDLQEKTSEVDYTVMIESWSDPYTNDLMIKTIQTFPIKDIYMNFLEHINDDFDDDLLLEILQLLNTLS